MNSNFSLNDNKSKNIKERYISRNVLNNMFMVEIFTKPNKYK